MQSNILSLQAATLEYWCLSRHWNGIDPSPPTIENALYRIGDSLQHLNPARPLAARMRRLQMDIIRMDDPQEDARMNEDEMYQELVAEGLIEPTQPVSIFTGK